MFATAWFTLVTLQDIVYTDEDPRDTIAAGHRSLLYATFFALNRSTTWPRATSSTAWKSGRRFKSSRITASTRCDL